MDFIFSQHALEQMLLRSIDAIIVKRILHNPDRIIVDEDVSIYQSVITLDDKLYLVRIFVNANQNPFKVITVYKTSKIQKYNEGKI